MTNKPMTDHCAYPKCGKELIHIPGRKKKKYCNQNCNTRHWQMMNPSYKPKTKRVPLEEWAKAFGENMQEVRPFSPSKTKAIIKPIVSKKQETVTVTLKVPTIPDDYPIKKDGESGMDFRIRLAEWEEKQLKNNQQ